MIAVRATHITLASPQPKLVRELYPGVFAVEHCRGVVSVRTYGPRIEPLAEADDRRFEITDHTLELTALEYKHLVEQVAMHRDCAAIGDRGGEDAAPLCVATRCWLSRATFPPSSAVDTQ